MKRIGKLEDKKIRSLEHVPATIPAQRIFLTSHLPAFLLLTLTLLLVVPRLASAQVRLPKLVGDGMVLQRNTGVRIWGWAHPGQEVTIRFLGKTYTATTRPDSEWAVMFEPMKAGGPYSMNINGMIIKNIMVGDVWLCSGQSNMWLVMRRIAPHWMNIIKHSTNPDIREFLVPARYDFNRRRKSLDGGSWKSVNPYTIYGFSATGYFFARALWNKYHVPIGMINAAVGGTPIQSWLSAKSLKEFPAARERADKFKSKAYVDSVIASNDSIQTKWSRYIRQNDKGLQGKPWYSASYNASSWPTMDVPNFWNGTSLKNTHGVVWFRRSFNVPASLDGKPARLYMGRIVNADYDYINGVLVGYTSYQYPERRYNVAAGLLHEGRNTITVRLINRGGPGGFIKDKPYELKFGNRVIKLDGKWHYKLGVASKPMAPTTTIWYVPLGLYNGMIAPLENYTILGALWYQGESNAGNPAGYGKMLKSMITDWRAKWGEGNFPFLTVQLPNYGPVAKKPGPSGWAQIQWDELKTLELPKTGVAITLGLGEWNDVHPWRKQGVGNRLALAAEHVAYGENDIVYSGPTYKSAEIEGNKIVVKFRHTGTGLTAKGGGPLKWFEIAGKNGKFVFAKAKIAGSKVIVWSSKVQHPTAARYAWATDAMGANLYNKEGLQASPFKTGVLH